MSVVSTPISTPKTPASTAQRHKRQQTAPPPPPPTLGERLDTLVTGMQEVRNALHLVAFHIDELGETKVAARADAVDVMRQINDLVRDAFSPFLGLKVVAS
jgi:hypothetical protein